MLRFSIRSLLLLVALVAVAIASFKASSPLVASLLFTSSVVSLGLAFGIAWVGHGTARAFAAGYAAIGLLYLAVAFATRASDTWREFLLTKRVVDSAFDSLGHKTADLYFSDDAIGNSIFTFALGWLGGAVAVHFAGRPRPTAESGRG